MMQDFLTALESIAPWLVGLSVASIVLVAVAVPIVAITLPADYFRRRERALLPLWTRHPLLHGPLLIVKNSVALVLIAFGVALLLLPGQGLLTILIGVLMLDFPGKYRLERWLLYRPRIVRTLNRIRARAGKAPFQMADADSARAH